MKAISAFTSIYLHAGAVDLRKGINGLCMIVDKQLGLDALAGQCLFAFTNRKRDRLRLLYWDKTGFAYWHKHLEEDRFRWPKAGSESSIQLNAQELEWLLDGIDLSKIKPHTEKQYKSVV